jgi:NAD dependent epimerase/dehydratase family enzyme
MGEMADAVLDSTRVLADKIQATGFTFEYPAIDKALDQLLG